MSKKNLSPRIALVYDRVNTPYGGAENVLLALHQTFPDAPLFTAVYDAHRAQWARVFRVIPSFVQKIPFAQKFHRLFVGLMPLAFESFELDEYDVIISITSAEAKGVLTKPHQLHLCYLLTPTRYLWSHTEEYAKHWLTGGIRQIIFRYLQWWDQAAAARPDLIIPISHLVAARCQQYYQRETLPVIYPPVETGRFEKERVATHLPFTPPKEFDLIVARLVPYKRIDLAIEACARLGRNLVIIGEGPDLFRLQNLAKKALSQAKKGGEILFHPSVQPQQCSAYYLQCRSFLAPAEEDFGITALEAQAAGKPVVIYQKSGAAELIEDGITGVYFAEHSVESLQKALQKCDAIQWQKDRIQRQVSAYDTAQFQRRFVREIAGQWEIWQKGKGNS